MRFASVSLTSMAALLLGCPGDDSSVVDTSPPMLGDDSTSTSGATGVDPTTSGVGTGDGDDTSGSSGVAETGSEGSSGSDGSSSTGPVTVCGDEVVEGDEICDGTNVGERTCMSLGYDAGDLGCLEDCSDLDLGDCAYVCGNAQIAGDEVCDGEDLGGATCRSEGFDSGTISCVDDCSAFDTSACGQCGNVIVDGDELCDGVALLGETCETQGFEYGDLVCAADCQGFDTAGCGLCGDGSIGGSELCDGMDLGGETCETLGGTGGTLACTPTCNFDLSACDLVPLQYDISAPNSSGTLGPYFRGHGYDADGDGNLIDFEVYMGLAAPCDLDFYVFEAPAFGGPYTQVVRTTVPSGPGTAYYPANLPAPVPVVNGNYYMMGVGWNCAATYYWDNSGAWANHDSGVGIFNVSHWDNAYPGASDMYFPPNTGGGSTAYVHRVFYAGT